MLFFTRLALFVALPASISALTVVHTPERCVLKPAEPLASSTLFGGGNSTVVMPDYFAASA